MLTSALHLPETIDRNLFKVYDTRTFKAYLFLKNTGIAHTVCCKMKKVTCKSCNDKEACEGVKNLKASLKASQEASMKEMESEGSTQQIEEAENADKQKLSEDLIKPDYHINISFDLIEKKKWHDLPDIGFYYIVQHFIPPYKKEEKCKCEYSNEYLEADPIEQQWYKKFHFWLQHMCIMFQYTSIQPKANASVRNLHRWRASHGYLQGHTTLHYKVPYGFVYQNPI